jgi:hypothetical protein
VSYGRPTFGVLLAAAYRSISAAAAQRWTVTPGRDVQELARAVEQMTTVLSRYTSDLTRNIDQLPDKQLANIGPWERAALRTHDALECASKALADCREPGRDVRARSQRARSLEAAATSLAAGRDLLQGHFSTELSGARLHQSSWAMAITSRTVSSALLAEVASLARHTAAACPADASQTSRAGLDGVTSRLNAAHYWLSQPDMIVSEAEQSERTGLSGREVLHAIPTNVLPMRVADAHEVAELFSAVNTTAERTRRAAWAAARVDPHSAAISVTSWRRVAAANTVTSHHCYLMFAALADRMAERGAEDLSAELTRAAAAANSAREHWLDSAREFQEITTEVRGHMSLAAVEAAQLALWTGRLAYADSDWKLSSGPSRPARSGADLAPEVDDVPRVASSLHEASDAVSCLAVANLEQARLAVQAHRVLVSTRLLPERRNVALRFAEAPESYTVSLVACCEATTRAAANAAERASETAARVGAQSRILTTAKVAARDQKSETWPRSFNSGARAKVLDVESAGPVESRLQTMGVTSARILWRARAIDRAGDQVVGDANAALAWRRAQAVSAGHSIHGRGSAGHTQGHADKGPDNILVPASRQLEAEP